jgi:serine/threonine protein phosphatase PrpC
MKRRAASAYQDNYDNRSDFSQWPFLSVVPLWIILQGDVENLPGWVWLLLASSPIVAIIIILAVGIVVLLFIIRRRSKRQQAFITEQQAAAPPPTPPEPSPDSVDSRTADTGELPDIRPALGEDPKETIPVGTILADELATQPSMLAEPLPPPPVELIPLTSPTNGERPAGIGWQIAGLTDVGLKRDHNEDNLLLVEANMTDTTPYGLYVVADGLGGHQGGEIASKLSVDTIQEICIQNPPNPAEAPYEEWLKAVALAANQSVLDHQEDQTQAKKMGSTVVMALVTQGKAHIANVGDSRAYLLGKEGIKQISVDHSLVERLVQIGQLTREEARVHRNRNVIYNTLGDKADPEVGLYHVDLEPGDRLLLCSDGLNDMVTDAEILEISQSNDVPADVCKLLVEAARTAGGNDNITAIVVQIDA